MSQRSSSRLFKARRKRGAGCLVLLALLAAAITLVLALNGFSNRFVHLEKRSVTVLNLPRKLEGFTILHLSDLHAASLGHKQGNLRTALGKEAYQAVALSGDMVGRSGKVGPLLDLIDQLNPGIPVFLVAGDSDPDALLSTPHGEGSVKADWVQQAEAKGAIFLETPYLLESDGQRIWFVPGELMMLDLKNAVFALKELVTTLSAADNPYEPATGAQLRHAQHRLDVMEQSLAAFTQVKDGDMMVALLHHPPDNQQLSELLVRSRAGEAPSPSLFLAGQFNNGQVRLPGLGPVYIPVQADGRGGYLPGDEGFTGLFLNKSFPVHISPGLGISGYYPLPLRLFNRPAATLIRLTAKMTR